MPVSCRIGGLPVLWCSGYGESIGDQRAHGVASLSRFSPGETPRSWPLHARLQGQDDSGAGPRPRSAGDLHLARAASLHDLHLATGLPKATLTRVILTLEKRGLVWQRLADGAYVASHTFQPRAPQLSDENYLVEVASPVMERLCRKVNWPSVLAVPRLDCMEVIETNRPKSYFSHVPVGPIGFRINLLRSATGRAYIAFCSESERQAMLQRLAASNEPGNFMARSRRWWNACSKRRGD